MGFLTFLEVITAILLTITILLQHKASGLSSTFGGSGAIYVQRRGAEKLLFTAAVWLSIVFFGLAVIDLYV